MALTAVADAATVGWQYGCSCNRDASLLAQSISNVFRQRAAEAWANGRSRDIDLACRFVAAAIAAGPYSLIVLTGPFLFASVLGSEWRSAGVFASILAVAGFFSFVAGVTDRSAMILNRPGYMVVWHSLRLISEVVAAASLLFNLLSVFNYVLLVAILQVAVYAVELVYIQVIASGARSVAGPDSGTRLTDEV